MFYGIIARAQSPIEVYEQVNHDVGRRLDGQAPDGCLCHVARAVDDGFEVMEIWENQDKQETFMRETLEPAIKASGQDMSQTTWTSFEPHNVQVSQLSQDA